MTKTYSFGNIYIFEWSEFKAPNYTDRNESFAVAEIFEFDTTVDASPGNSLVMEPAQKPNTFYARFNGTIHNIYDYKEGGCFYLGKTLREAHDKLYQVESEDRKNG